MSLKFKRTTKYKVTCEEKFISFFEEKGMLLGKKSTGLEIIGKIAIQSYNAIAKEKDNRFIKLIFSSFDKKITYSTDALLPICKQATISNKWKKAGSKDKFLSILQMNLILSFIFANENFSKNDILSFFDFIEPQAQECIDHFNFSIYVLIQLLSKQKITPKSFFWLEKVGVNGFVFKHSVIRKEYEKRKDVFIEVLLGSRQRSNNIDSNSSLLLKKPEVLKDNIKPIKLINYRNYYKENLEKLSFYKFIKNAKKFEQQVLQDVFALTKQYFSLAGYTYIEMSNCFKKGNDYILFEQNLTNDEKGQVLFFSFNRKNQDIIAYPSIYVAKISHFGRIQEVIISSVNNVSVDVVKLVSEIKGLVLGAYATLEQQYLIIAKQFYRQFTNVYNLVNSVFEEPQKKSLKGKFNLLFGVGGNLNMVVYFFDDNGLEKLIDLYKTEDSSDVLGKSSFEKVISMTTGIIPFDKSVGLMSLNEKKPIKLPWLKVPYFDSKRNYIQKEKLMYSGRECVGYTPCVVGDCCFIIACDEKYQKVVMNEIIGIKNEIQIELERTHKQFHTYIDDLNKELKLDI